MGNVYRACQNMVSVVNDYGCGDVGGNTDCNHVKSPRKKMERICDDERKTEASAEDHLATVIAGKCQAMKVSEGENFISCQPEGEIQVSSRVQTKREAFVGWFAGLFQ